ncbi:MAG: acyl carrier protein [Dermatophilaceae bacterium]|mgnify:CR=1 FL=1
MPAVDVRTPGQVQDYLAGLVARTVGVAGVTADDNIFDLGLDSLQLVEVKEAVRADLGVTLKFSDFFTHFTVADLATLVDARTQEN